MRRDGEGPFRTGLRQPRGDTPVPGPLRVTMETRPVAGRGLAAGGGAARVARGFESPNGGAAGGGVAALPEVLRRLRPSVQVPAVRRGPAAGSPWQRRRLPPPPRRRRRRRRAPQAPAVADPARPFMVRGPGRVGRGWPSPAGMRLLRRLPRRVGSEQRLPPPGGPYCCGGERETSPGVWMGVGADCQGGGATLGGSSASAG